MNTNSQEDFPKFQHFAVRLNARMAQMGIDGKQLAEISGLSTSAISNYRKGAALPNAEGIFTLAAALNVNAKWLVFGEGTQFDVESEWPELTDGFGEKRYAQFQHELKSGIKHFLPHNQKVPADPDTWIVKLPIADLTYCDDLGLETFQDSIAFPSTTLDGVSPHGIDGMMAGLMPTDALMPTINQGATIVIDGNDRILRDGVFAFKLGDNLQIKRLRPLGLKTVEILSDNPLYKPQTISGDDLSALKIMGRVCLAIKRV